MNDVKVCEPKYLDSIDGKLILKKVPRHAKFLTECVTSEILVPTKKLLIFKGEEVQRALNFDLIVYSKVYAEYRQKKDAILVVPKTFVSDGASVPRLPFVFWFCGGRGSRAAIVHDWLYRTNFVPKDVADKIFLELLLLDKEDLLVRRLMYRGVEFGGSSSYRDGKKNLCAYLDGKINHQTIFDFMARTDLHI